MSGYLGRMWTSMVKGAVSLRPLAGSIYADHGITQHTTAFGEIGLEQNNEERVDPVPASNASTFKAHGPAVGREETRAQESTNIKYEPLLPPPSRHSLEPPAAAHRADASDGFDLVDNWNQRPEKSVHGIRPPNLGEFRSQAAAEHAPVKDVPTADVIEVQTGDARVDWELDRRTRDAESRGTLASDESARQPEPLAPALRQQPVQIPQQRGPAPVYREIAPRPAAERDVQVHIGRIEVVAVQPPAPRAPAPRQSRTTSLDDYLSSRSSRNR